MNTEMRKILDEIFEDEFYDMCDEIPQEEIYSRLSTVFFMLNLGSKTQTFKLHGYVFKVYNYYHGWVSCSNSEQTSVSYTEYLPYPNDGEHDKKECYKNLLDMMNEAWYALNH